MRTQQALKRREEDTDGAGLLPGPDPFASKAVKDNRPGRPLPRLHM